MERPSVDDIARPFTAALNLVTMKTGFVGAPAR
jgi:hypothetical protein